MVRPVVEVRSLLRRSARHEVWLAASPPSGPRVALKRSSPPLAEPPSELDHEAAVLAAVRHPHLLELHAAVPDPLATAAGGPAPALALELADAGSLADVVASSGGLSPAQVAVVLVAAAGALHALHEQGWLHGDVSPANLLYDRGRGPLVADLGSAARLGAPLPTGFATTRAFAAPELRPGAVADRRADVYALGSTALWLLASTRGVLPAERLAPGALVGVLLRAVQRDPGRRQPTLAHLLTELLAAEVPLDADGLRRHAGHRRGSPGRGGGREVAPLVTARFGADPPLGAQAGGEPLSAGGRWAGRALRRRGA